MIFQAAKKTRFLLRLFFSIFVQFPSKWNMLVNGSFLKESLCVVLSFLFAICLPKSLNLPVRSLLCVPSGWSHGEYLLALTVGEGKQRRRHWKYMHIRIIEYTVTYYSDTMYLNQLFDCFIYIYMIYVLHTTFYYLLCNVFTFLYIYIHLFPWYDLCMHIIQLTHISEDLTHKMEGQPSQTEVSWVLGMFSHVHVYFMIIQRMIMLFTRHWIRCFHNTYHLGWHLSRDWLPGECEIPCLFGLTRQTHCLWWCSRQGPGVTSWDLKLGGTTWRDIAQVLRVFCT